jgi:hypothetical protein
MNIVLLNGPPRVGKDTVGRALLSLSRSSEVAKFAGELKDAVHRLYGLNVPPDYFETRKDEPCEELHGQIPRALYLALSERYFKPMHGPDIFGRLLVKTLRGMEAAGKELVAITDSGFREEAEAVLKVFPNALLVRLHRNGTSFVGDSRSHIQLGIEAIDFRNDSPDAPRHIAEFIDSYFNDPLRVR